MTPYARSEWDRYADGWTRTACTCPPIWHGVIPPLCPLHNPPSGVTWTATSTDALRPPETDTDPEPRDHYRRGDADLGCGLMVIIAAVAALALLVWIAGRGR